MTQLLARIVLSAVLVGSVAAAVVESDALVVLKRGEDCRSSCTARHGDDPPFTLSFNSYEEGYRTYIDLRIENREFRRLPISRRFIKDGSLPFEKHRFPRHTLYGLESSRSTKNMRTHYFIRSNDGFRHLGRFSKLGYDTELGLFVEFAYFKTGATRYYYRLQNGRLVEEEDF